MWSSTFVDEEGRPSFQALHHQSAHSVVFYAFDILHLNGRDLTRLPLEERRAELGPLVEGTHVLGSDPLPGNAERVEAVVRRFKLEGLVAKRRQSVYEPGRRTKSWLKVKFSPRQEFVIGGFKPNATNFDSLLVGYYEGRRLRYAEKVRAGLTPHLRAEIFRRLAPLQTARCAFADLPNSKTSHWGEGITAEDMKKLRWVRPKQVVEVSFVEWARDGHLRHSAFVGLRDDKRPNEARRETTSTSSSLPADLP